MSTPSEEKQPTDGCIESEKGEDIPQDSSDEVPQKNNNEEIDIFVCPTCYGYGQIHSGKCRNCHGRGYTRRKS